MSFDTPIALLIFNRPDVTRRVFDAIRQVRPRQLFVVGDGAREDRPGERMQVNATRSLVDNVDWPCDVQTCFSDTNLGCKRRVSSGLAWLFGQVEDAIILEDDCLPDPSFFPYCQVLLDRYRDDPRIGAISGDNFQDGIRRTPHSYYFSKYFHCWGWASWRRVWERYDLEMNAWPEFREHLAIESFADSECERWFWNDTFDKQHRGEIDSWAYPWLFSCWTQNALTVLPSVNLISNIGFSEDATHCTSAESQFANLPVGSLHTLQHPKRIYRNVEADRYTFLRNFYRDTWSRRTRRRVRQWMSAGRKAG